MKLRFLSGELEIESYGKSTLYRYTTQGVNGVRNIFCNLQAITGIRKLVAPFIVFKRYGLLEKLE